MRRSATRRDSFRVRGRRSGTLRRHRDAAGKVLSIAESQKKPLANWAITGLYFYNNDVLRYASELKPSHRGELEITDINQRYLEACSMHVERMGRGYAWLDTGTTDSYQLAQTLTLRA